MSQHLLLKSFLPAGGAAHDLGTINVFVGPNNAGKSEALRDLARLAGNFEPTGQERVKGEEPRTSVVQDVHFVSKLSLERLLQGMTTIETGTSEGRIAQGIGPDLQSPYRRTIPGDLKHILFRPTITARSVALTGLGDLMPLRVAYLPAEVRRRLIEPAAASSPLRAPQSLLSALEVAGVDVAEQLGAAMAEIFDGRRLVVDATERVQLSLRVAETAPTATGDPILDAQAYSRLRDIALEGAGFQHVAAIVSAMLVCQGRVLLIDQPETALDPEHCRRLAVWIAENAAALGCQVILATHSPYLLAGLYGGGADAHVWRLSRRGDTTRFDPVPVEAGRALSTFPLFTSQSAIACLMRDGVVIAPESEDRVIYQAVAERVLRAHNLGFVQAHGTRNLTFAATTFRRANLPTCVVAELDFLQSETQFNELVKTLSGKPPSAPWLATRERLVSHVEGKFDEEELSAASTEVETFLDELKKGSIRESPGGRASRSAGSVKWKRLRRERLAMLPPELRIWVEELVEELKRIGLFISPRGGREGWIAFAADAEDPAGWLNRAMQLLHTGECPADLRGFVAEIVAQIHASAATAGATRSSHGA